jgi:hypothetical protein
MIDNTSTSPKQPIDKNSTDTNTTNVFGEEHDIIPIPCYSDDPIVAPENRKGRRFNKSKGKKFNWDKPN